MQEQEEQAGPLGSEEYVAQPDRSKFGWILLITALLAVAALSLILVPNFLRARARGQLTACKSNLKNIATALEMYATDNAGRYPQSLEKLVDSKLLNFIPTCPSAGKMTYLDYQVVTNPDSFSFSCCGSNHKASFAGYKSDSTGFPKYNAIEGLLDHP